MTPDAGATEGRWRLRPVGLVLVLTAGQQLEVALAQLGAGAKRRMPNPIARIASGGNQTIGLV